MKHTWIFTIILCAAVNNLYGQTHQLLNSVVVGGVTSNSANFFIRISASGIAENGIVNIDLSESSDFINIISGNPYEANAGNNFSVIIKVSDLKSDTKYFYRVTVDNNIIDESERYFRTFPQNGSEKQFVFGFGSCQQSGGFLNPTTPEGNIYNEVIKHDPYFFLQIGDWGYHDSTDNAPYDNNFFPQDYSIVRQTYYNRYDINYPMDQLFRIAPVDYIYDDHDFMNNNSSALTSSYPIANKPNEFGDDYGMLEVENPAGARENSIKGYKENFPGYELVNESRGIYHKFTFGTADFFMLDLRSQRSSNLNAFVKNNTTGKWEFNPDNNHSILGRDDSPGSGENQRDWFFRELKNSTATWKFIISSVPFNAAQRRAVDLSMQIQDNPLNYPQAPPGTNAIIAAMELSDKWVGFPSDQDLLLNFVEENNIKNVIVLSGDAHTAAIDDGTNAGLPEIMAGGLDISNSKVAALFNLLNLKIWNRGGQGLTTTTYNNAFGKVTVYGSDSVNLSLIDEFSTLIASYSIKNNTTDVISGHEVPRDFILEQNYPNPFNPSTKIKFAVPKESKIELKLFDILGTEIAILLNETMPAGIHNYDLHISKFKLASGLYFYQLQAEGVTITKKMILLR